MAKETRGFQTYADIQDETERMLLKRDSNELHEEEKKESETPRK